MANAYCRVDRVLFVFVSIYACVFRSRAGAKTTFWMKEPTIIQGHLHIKATRNIKASEVVQRNLDR